MSEDLKAFQVKFRIADLRVASVGAWDISVRPAQVTLGSLVVSLSSGGQSLADMMPSEAADLGQALALADWLARTVYGAERTNALCLMMQDPIVHFHVLPRYSAPKDAYGLTWIDADWPKPSSLKSVPLDENALFSIRDELSAAARQR